MNVFLRFLVSETATTDHVGARTRPTCAERIQLHLGDLWTISHAVFAGCMWATFFTSSVFGATVLISIIGFSSAISMWAPFVLAANAILTEPARDVDGSRPIPLSETRRANAGEYQSLVGAETEEDGENIDETRSESSSFEEETQTQGISIMGNANARVSQLDLHTPSPRQQGGISDKAGVILGIHNIFVVIPQFLLMGLSSVIFVISEPDVPVLPGHKLPARNPAGIATLSRSDTVPRPAKPVETNLVAVIFRVGGVLAFIAMVLCWQLMRELKHR